MQIAPPSNVMAKQMIFDSGLLCTIDNLIKRTILHNKKYILNGVITYNAKITWSTVYEQNMNIDTKQTTHKNKMISIDVWKSRQINSSKTDWQISAIATNRWSRCHYIVISAHEYPFFTQLQNAYLSIISKTWMSELASVLLSASLLPFGKTHCQNKSVSIFSPPESFFLDLRF